MAADDPTSSPQTIDLKPERIELAPLIANAVRRGAAIEGVSVVEYLGRALGLYFQVQRAWLRGGKLLIEERNGELRLLGEPRT